MLKIDGYIVADDDAIYGIGAHAAEAWSDFVDYMRSAGLQIVEGNETDELYPNQIRATGFRTYPATDALIAAVKRDGGAIAWCVRGGVACTPAESED
jgi:hypothetical protein